MTKIKNKNKFFVSLIVLIIFYAGIAKANDITPDKVIQLVNASRTDAGVPVLEKNDLLQIAAEQKAQDMISNDYFAHISPQGKTPWDFISQANYNYRYAGENLAINYTSVQKQHDAWMESLPHRKNILNPDYREIGVAVKQGVIEGHSTTVTVQEFGTQMADILNDQIENNSNNISSGLVASAHTESRGSLITKITNFFKNKNRIIVFILALLLVIVDFTAIFYKKHRLA